MIHDADHDPIERYDPACEVCGGIRRRAFNGLTDVPLGAKDADNVIATLREIVEREEDHALARHLEAL